MKVIEILQINKISLKILQNACIKVSDVQYIDMYDDYRKMISDGEKKSYAVAVLMDKYNISERQVYYMVKRLEKDCKILAT